MDSLLGDFWWQGVGWNGTAKNRPTLPGQVYLTKYSRWKLSGWLIVGFWAVGIDC